MVYTITVVASSVVTGVEFVVEIIGLFRFVAERRHGLSCPMSWCNLVLPALSAAVVNEMSAGAARWLVSPTTEPTNAKRKRK